MNETEKFMDIRKFNQNSYATKRINIRIMKQAERDDIMRKLEQSIKPTQQ